MEIIDLGWPWRSLTTSIFGYPSDRLVFCCIWWLTVGLSVWCCAGDSAKAGWADTSMEGARGDNCCQGREAVWCKPSHSLWAELWWHWWLDQWDWVADYHWWRRPWLDYCQSPRPETECMHCFFLLCILLRQLCCQGFVCIAVSLDLFTNLLVYKLSSLLTWLYHALFCCFDDAVRATGRPPSLEKFCCNHTWEFSLVSFFWLNLIWNNDGKWAS